MTVDAPALGNDNTPTITGTTDLPAGATVTLTVTDALGAVQTVTASVQADGTYRADVPAALAEGSYTVVASATDAAGNGAAASDSGVIDLTPPTLSVAAPAVTNDSTPTITGTTDLPAGSIVTLAVTDANGLVQVFTAIVQVGGTFSADVPSALAQGSYSVAATATDPAGNNADANASGAIDTNAPSLSIDAPALTNDSTPTISGTTDQPSGSTVTITVTDALGAVQTLSATVQPGGTYSVDVPTALAEGTYTVDATITSAAGSSANANDSGAIDVTPPAAGLTLDAVTADNTVNPGEATASITITGTVSGDVRIGDTVTLIVNGNPTSGTVLAGNRFAIDVAGADLLADADRRIDASVTTADAAGNATTATTTRDYLVNFPPVANADALLATEDTAATFGAAQLLGNDSDADGNALSIASVTSGTGGTAVLNGDGTVTFTPNANFNGAADFTYTVTDGSLVSSATTVTVSVAAVNDLPITTDATAGTGENTVLASSVPAATDADGTIASYALVAGAADGTLSFNTDGTYTFDPGATSTTWPSAPPATSASPTPPPTTTAG